MRAQQNTIAIAHKEKNAFTIPTAGNVINTTYNVTGVDFAGFN
jgi:hypothetical protein